MPEEKLFISLNDFAQFPALAANLNSEKRLNNYILEAMDEDLKNLLGPELYIDLTDDFNADPQLQTYANLFNGLSYTYNDVKYKHKGLVPILCYFTYARHLVNGNIHSTPFGPRTKRTEDSDAISAADLGRMISQARASALSYWADTKKFLDHYANTYTLWSCGKGDYPSSGIVEITDIG